MPKLESVQDNETQNVPWDVDLVWLVWFYGISTYIGHLTPNPFSISTQFNCQKHFYFKLFSLLNSF